MSITRMGGRLLGMVHEPAYSAWEAENYGFRDQRVRANGLVRRTSSTAQYPPVTLIAVP